MILEDSSTRERLVSELNNLVTSRAMTIIFISLSCLLVCQIIKFVIASVKNKALEWYYFKTTGGFPSSHSGFVVCLTISLGMFQWHDLDRLDWSFAVAVVFSVIVLHDAMGVRLEASKHAKILNNMTADLPIEEKKKLGFGQKGFLKEMLGHKGFEVLGGILMGIIFAIAGFFIVIAVQPK